MIQMAARSEKSSVYQQVCVRAGLRSLRSKEVTIGLTNYDAVCYAMSVKMESLNVQNLIGYIFA